MSLPTDPVGDGLPMNVNVNGQPRTLPTASTLADLMAAIGAADSAKNAQPAPQATATAVNGEFVSIRQRAGRVLCEGDQITCFQLIVGG